MKDGGEELTFIGAERKKCRCRAPKAFYIDP